MLAARAARPVRVDPEIGLVDVHPGVVREQRTDHYLCEGRVPTVRLVERRQPDEAVDAPLRLEDAVGVLPAGGERRRLQSGLLSRARLDQLDLEAALLRPPEVHAEEDLRPVLRVGSARAGVDRDHRVAAVVLAVEEGVLAQAVELVLDRPDVRFDLVRHAAVELEQVACVLVVLQQTPVALQPLRHPGMLGRDLCRPLLVVPEAGPGHLGLELCRALL